MEKPIFGETTCYVCGQNINYVGELGSTKMIKTDSVIAESVVATGNVPATNGVMVELEIVVKCPKCESKNKTTDSIPSV
ncbi:hypothetical protein D1B33_08460 [Lysinibacillus yapensis]|uniref:Uncharacterized protein n=1 Tax=Ureibacillus yapensis TaxID=2304605 RepID=A0A396S9C8_9BACL|nr:hypothetical protein [Lysinibacillus yapensis]RHW37553.1 hypothetical protein D1B33_08460 [Lysinibacillus yapensis]